MGQLVRRYATVHVIFRHKNPLDGSIEEKHLKNPPQMTLDALPHLYTLAAGLYKSQTESS